MVWTSRKSGMVFLLRGCRCAVSDSILVASARFDHDRDTAVPDPEPTGRDTAISALQSLRLDGAIFFRAELTESWAFGSPPSRELAPGLRPGAERLIMFHIVAAGKCWIECGGG